MFCVVFIMFYSANALQCFVRTAPYCLVCLSASWLTNKISDINVKTSYKKVSNSVPHQIYSFANKTSIKLDLLQCFAWKMKLWVVKLYSFSYNGSEMSTTRIAPLRWLSYLFLCIVGSASVLQLELLITLHFHAANVTYNQWCIVLEISVG